MEMVAEAKLLITKMVCDKCKDGEMVPSGGAVLCSDPPLFPHVCDKCGNFKSYKVRYPGHKIVPIEPFRKPVGNEAR